MKQRENEMRRVEREDRPLNTPDGRDVTELELTQIRDIKMKEIGDREGENERKKE